MQKKKRIVVGIGVVVMMAGILGYSLIPDDTGAVETTVEAVVPAVEADSPVLEEEEPEIVEESLTEEIVEAEEVLENISDTKSDILQEDAEKEEAPEQDVTEDEGMEEIDAYMYTTADLNVRKDHTTESDVIEVIPYGTEIHVTARTADNWYCTERDEIGYVSGKYLSEEEPAPRKQEQAQTSNSGIGGYNRYGEYIEGVSQEDLDLLESLVPDYGPYTGPIGVQPSVTLPPNPNSPDGKWHLVH